MSESAGPAESRALMTSLAEVKPDAATACAQWTAHDVVAHLAAGAEEIAELIEDMLAGRPPRATRSFDEREAPFVALPDAELRDVMVEVSRRKIIATDALAARGPGASVEFTGRAFTAVQLQTHARSEAALHRWDMVGDDDTGDVLLAQPELTRHAVDVLNTLPMLFESPGARTDRSKLIDARVVLRSPDQPDVVLIADSHGPTRFELCTDGPATGEVLITTDAVNRLLTLWGRRSARRTTTSNPLFRQHLRCQEPGHESRTWKSFAMVEQTFLATDNPAVVLTQVHARARATGRELDFPILQTVTVRDGRITEIRPFYWDTASIRSACTPVTAG